MDVVLKNLDESDIERAYKWLRGRADMAPELEAQISDDGKPNERFRELIVNGVDDSIRHLPRGEWESQIGVACFSSKCDDLLMWAHYADGHRGFCLEFSTQSEPFSRAEPVTYCDSIPEVNPLDILDGKSTGPDLMQMMLRTKFTCWQYEEEWRILHMRAGTAYSYPFEALTGVYFGVSMSRGQKDVIGQLLLGTPVRLYEMSRGTGGFVVEPTSVTYTPYDPRTQVG